MKTAVSVPNEVFEKAERLARSTGRSRSQVYSDALREYVARHSSDEITEALDRVIVELGSDGEDDGFVRRAAARTLGSVEW
jgi:metal-responsive CopG/Arc/MetJ family transcriptional regulator